jgi:tetrahydromethanopterin S-methyltransferase subunit G
MENEIYHNQINKELKSMDQRLYDLEEKMISIDGKLTQVVDAILGNPLTKSGGFIDDVNSLKEKVKSLESKVEKQEEFKKRIAWTSGIVIGSLFLIEKINKIYTLFS